MALRVVLRVLRDGRLDVHAVGRPRRAGRPRRRRHLPPQFPVSPLLDVKHQSGLNVSAFFDTGDLRHELKFGFGYRHMRFDSAVTGPATWSSATAGSTRRSPSRGPKREATSTTPSSGTRSRPATSRSTSGAGSTTSKAGILPRRFRQSRLPGLLPAVHYGGDAGYPITWRQVQPRVGATYALGDHRTLLRASYSRFATSWTARRSSRSTHFPEHRRALLPWNDANGNGRVEPARSISRLSRAWSNVDPFNPGSSSGRSVSKPLKPPTTDEFIVGVERQILPDLSGSVAYTYRLRNLEFSPLSGRPARATVPRQRDGDRDGADGTRPEFHEPYYGLTTCPDPCAGVVLENRPDASETYDGVELQLLKSLSHGWMARVTFAYNDWQQHIGPGAIINPNNKRPAPTRTGRSSIAASTRPGSSTSAAWSSSLGISAGVNLFGRQGFPIPYCVDVSRTAISDLSRPFRSDRRRAIGLRMCTSSICSFRRLPDRIAVTVIPEFDCFNLLSTATRSWSPGRRRGLQRRHADPRLFPGLQRRVRTPLRPHLSWRRSDHLLARFEVPVR